MLRHALRILFLNFFLLSGAWAAHTLALVLNDSSPPYQEFTTALTEALQGSAWRVGSVGKGDTLATLPAPDLIVTAGAEAFRQALAHAGSNTPIAATLISRQYYEKILAEAGKTRHRTSAIYIEQPINRQVAFLRQLLPGRLRAGMLVSSESSNMPATFRSALQSAGYTLDIEETDHDATLLPATNALLPRINFLLATPDPKVYKRENIKPILMTSYRHQKPVIAFSAAFVNAGALAALYSSPRQIAQQMADLLIAQGSNLPPPEYPQQFSIIINRSVAEALNLNLATESDIKRAMLAGKEAR